MSLRALMYHDITAEPTRARYGFELGQFKAHLDALAAAGLGAPSAPRAAEDADGWALTFDDGHPGWLAAAEALEARGWKAAFFVITSRIGAPGALDKAQLRRLDAAGHVVGSHSADHPDVLAARGDAFIADQWRRSKAALEDALGREVLSASVPGGSYARRVGESAAACGLRLLYTSEPVAAPWRDGECVVRGRYALVNGMGGAAAAALAGGRPIATWPQYLSWNMKKAAKAVVGGPYRALRRALYEGTT